ncbi:dihydrofolate reductase family protein [Streptomyces showdoensis]|uniref:Deaminase n=1 Tax=Streptomyces showdoensis TaxID=68268 RepID=A0A2P2GVD9_STREW|nr:dihydrofolate reductase family protein [Streptomyces showdoensis]KKZ75454.1 deaminase [Streptomyces showdoensis]
MPGKIVLFASVSLDGFMEGPDHDIDWHRVDEELHLHFNAELARMGGFISGRRTHLLMADYWPTADADPASSPAEREFAGIWRSMPKYVYSTTLEHADWNTTVVPRVDPAEVRALAAAAGGDLSLSGADLAASFREHDLIDAYQIYVHPVVIGRGTPLLTPMDSSADLRLDTTRAFPNGVVLLRYERERGA